MTRTLGGVAAAAAGLALAACGGQSDEQKVKDVASQLATTDPKVCDRATDKLLKSVGGLKQCKRAAKQGTGAQKAKVGKVKVDGDKATAQLSAGGVKGTIGLVKDGDDWKLDSVR